VFRRQAKALESIVAVPFDMTADEVFEYQGP
jgi:hypothetical protein